MVSAGLNQLFSMLNSQQIILFFPLIEKLKMPANVMMVTEELIKISNFNLFQT